MKFNSIEEAIKYWEKNAIRLKFEVWMQLSGVKIETKLKAISGKSITFTPKTTSSEDCDDEIS